MFVHHESQSQAHRALCGDNDCVSWGGFPHLVKTGSLIPFLDTHIVEDEPSLVCTCLCCGLHAFFIYEPVNLDLRLNYS